MAHIFQQLLLTAPLALALTFTTPCQASSPAPECSTVFQSKPTLRAQAIQHATQVAGIVVGSANEVIVSVTGVRMLTPEVAKWLPLFNEIANVASTSTEQSWIYSGLNKKVIDGIALGGIAGQAMHTGLSDGLLAGGLTLAVNVGLTYWFPNSYFKPIMQGIPKLLPAPVRKAAESNLGQGFIGISMIVMLEQILERAQHLALMVPQLISKSDIQKRKVANTGSHDLSPEHGLALVILSTALTEGLDDDSRILFYLAGANDQDDFFAETSKIPRPRRLERRTYLLLSAKINSPSIRLLLTESEFWFLNSRLRAISNP